MKKIYIKPYTETVNVRLFSSVLGGDPGVADWSDVTGNLGAKEQGELFLEDDGSFGDMWGGGDDTATANPYNLWE